MKTVMKINAFAVFFWGTACIFFNLEEACVQKYRELFLFIVLISHPAPVWITHLSHVMQQEANIYQ